MLFCIVLGLGITWVECILKQCILHCFIVTSPVVSQVWPSNYSTMMQYRPKKIAITSQACQEFPQSHDKAFWKPVLWWRGKCTGGDLKRVINFLADAWRDLCGGELDSKQHWVSGIKRLRTHSYHFLVQHMSAKKGKEPKKKVHSEHLAFLKLGRCPKWGACCRRYWWPLISEMSLLEYKIRELINEKKCWDCCDTGQ